MTALHGTIISSVETLDLFLTLIDDNDVNCAMAHYQEIIGLNQRVCCFSTAHSSQ